MYRTITIDNSEYTAEIGARKDCRVTIKDGDVSVSDDLEGRTPGAEFEAVFWGRERIDIFTAPEDENYIIGPLSEPTLADVKAAKRAEIAAARFDQETGGVVYDGMSIDTSRESQGLITGAALQATLDSTYTCQWKTAAGFVTLNAAAILAVAVWVRKHVQECFDREAELAADVEAAETVEAVWAVGWQSVV